MIRIVVVEDEQELREEIVSFLKMSGYAAAGVGDGAALDRHLQGRACDIVVLDVGLPGEDGYSIAARLHTAQPLGIIMLTARDQVDSRVQGLKSGADVYLVKPVDLTELAANVDSLYRRIAPLQRLGTAAASADDEWLLDSTEWCITAPAGQSMELTATEYRFVLKLAEARGALVSREEIVTALGHSYTYFDNRRIDSMMTRLRRKSESELGFELPIKTARAAGFAFTAPMLINSGND
ncbi:MAG: response regulator transcription factor [Sulfuricella sp.]|nr:response regulator transcription factor [Sulfuricella sp.]